MRTLFELGGTLTSKSKLILGISGVVFLLLLWALFAEVLAQDKLIEIDQPLANVTDKTYVESDSLMRDDYDLLLAKTPEELARENAA